MVYVKRSEDWLEHHGIQGQKWGVRNGPPYPLDYEQHNSSEKSKNPKGSLDNYENNNPKNGKSQYQPVSKAKGINVEVEKSALAKRIDNSVDNKVSVPYDQRIAEKNEKSHKGNFNLQENLGLTDEEYEKLKHNLKIAGIAVGTTAAVVAAAYMYTRLQTGYNLDATHRVVSLGDRLFNNAKNGDYIGNVARHHGYGDITAESLSKAMANPNNGKAIDYNRLVQNVRQNQLGTNSMRRLSCWSASNAYYMSAMTGGDYVSKSFENLVDFNDFGKLYNAKPQIYNLWGRKSSNFVGMFGKLGLRGGAETTEKVSKQLVQSIFSNIDEASNLAADGSRTVGFINAGYHSTTCTHQFNFEITRGLDGLKELFIADGYTGARYSVATMGENGGINYLGNGLNQLSHELHHYNANSIRFYAPSLGSINTEMMQNVILGNIIPPIPK